MKVELKKITLEPEEAKTRPKRWHSLVEAIHGYSSFDKPFDICRRRGLEVVVNTVEDGRVVAAIAGHVGVARSPLTALRRAAMAWDKATKPKGRKKR